MKLIIFIALVFAITVSAKKTNSTTPADQGNSTKAGDNNSTLPGGGNSTVTNPDPLPVPVAVVKLSVECPSDCPSSKGYFYRLKSLDEKAPAVQKRHTKVCVTKCIAGKVCDNGKCVDPKPVTAKFSCDCAKLDLVPFKAEQNTPDLPTDFSDLPVGV